MYKHTGTRFFDFNLIYIVLCDGENEKIFRIKHNNCYVDDNNIHYTLVNNLITSGGN